ncbi:hypothetical protein GIB67_005716 [Kingdonia uniflora]|uniref:GDSL esterase/lipase APG n=1 Tax=Kingdonia uniflora TaxID=39325 RepID=A0A7J7KVI9_9MAGN|nr:hypothetical protein GIB67_005716 [Kingdonia uniflora]
MRFSRDVSYSFLLIFVSMVSLYVAHGQTLVPGIITFGDSVVDVGNNNGLYTVVKANFPPYGRDFVSHSPTGRFCNGKLATDFTAENLGFSTYPKAYLNPEAKGKNLLIGANFASASSGYSDGTANLYSAISLTQQLRYFKEYQGKLLKVAKKSKASSIISDSIYVISAGTSDFIQNYYVNPNLYRAYTPDQYSTLLVQAFSAFAQNLYGLGARRMGVTSLPPMGCLPAAITLFGSGSNQCVERLNRDSLSFNTKLSAMSQALQKKYPSLKMVIFDIYQPLIDLIKKPSENGFTEARRACCGTGTIETSLLCNARSVGTCSNATNYVFWDGFHPSEAANKILADALLTQGITLIS